jgi:rubredoxin
MSSSEINKNESEETDPLEFYCIRCGIKSSMRKEMDCIYAGMTHEHNFQALPKDTYCVSCGVKPGTRTSCVFINNASHNFQTLPKDTYCTRCGVKPGIRTKCITEYTSLFIYPNLMPMHNFTLHPKETHCRRCGAKPGVRTVCVGPDPRHDFV